MAVVAPAPQARPTSSSHPCRPPTDQIGRWTCQVCGSGWRSTLGRLWERWSEADSVHLCAAWSFELAAAGLPWWRWRRRARLLTLADDARATAGTTW